MVRSGARCHLVVVGASASWIQFLPPLEHNGPPLRLAGYFSQFTPAHHFAVGPHTHNSAGAQCPPTRTRTQARTSTRKQRYSRATGARHKRPVSTCASSQSTCSNTQHSDGTAARNLVVDNNVAGGSVARSLGTLLGLRCADRWAALLACFRGPAQIWSGDGCGARALSAATMQCSVTRRAAVGAERTRLNNGAQAQPIGRRRWRRRRR